MAAKRLRDESDQDEREDKRLRKLPSFSAVIRDVMLTSSLQKLVLALEPVLRRVVQEEVERALPHGAIMFQRTSPRQLQIESPTFKLGFVRQPQLPIFTSSKIEDADGNCLHIVLIDAQTGERSPAQPSPAIRLEIVAINGDFPGDREDWTAEEFNDSIVRERDGKRPLLIGDLNVTLRDGIATAEELMFTDNSSWIRCRNFRIGVRIVPGSYTGPRITEAITVRFPVKDHRGELYRKHYPPRLNDEVWRLEKIGKDGAFHAKLSKEKVNSVKDFLKLSVIDPGRLRSILGLAMSDRMWEATVNHARTCQLGEKRYLYRGPYFTIILNPICEVLGVYQDGILYKPDHLIPQQKDYVQLMARQAYINWDKVEEADGFFVGDTPPIQNERVAQGFMASTSPSSSWYASNQQIAASSEFQIGLDEDQIFETIFSLDTFIGPKTKPA